MAMLASPMVEVDHGKPGRREELFAGRHFDREVILACVRWYLRFKLSLPQFYLHSRRRWVLLFCGNEARAIGEIRRPARTQRATSSAMAPSLLRRSCPTVR
jgi:hypothetical protein